MRSARRVHFRTGHRTHWTCYQRTLTSMNAPINSVFDVSYGHDSWTVPGQCLKSAQPSLDRVRIAASCPLLLVVDDEEPVLRVVERLAARTGFDVIACGSGSEAMQALIRKPADLAMVDLRMPDVNGLDLLRQIRSTAPSCEVILMTAYAAVDSAVEAIKLGAREYLTKPFDFERLKQVDRKSVV